MLNSNLIMSLAKNINKSSLVDFSVFFPCDLWIDIDLSHSLVENSLKLLKWQTNFNKLTVQNKTIWCDEYLFFIFVGLCNVAFCSCSPAVLKDNRSFSIWIHIKGNALTFYTHTFPNPFDMNSNIVLIDASD